MNGGCQFAAISRRRQVEQQVNGLTVKESISRFAQPKHKVVTRRWASRQAPHNLPHVGQHLPRRLADEAERGAGFVGLGDQLLVCRLTQHTDTAHITANIVVQVAGNISPDAL